MKASLKPIANARNFSAHSGGNTHTHIRMTRARALVVKRIAKNHVETHVILRLIVIYLFINK